MSRQSPYPPELRRRAVRMVDEVRDQYDTEFAAITRRVPDRSETAFACAGLTVAVRRTRTVPAAFERGGIPAVISSDQSRRNVRRC